MSRRRSFAVAAASVAVAVVVAACGGGGAGDGDGGAPEAGAPSRPQGDLVEVRGVQSSSPPPCADGAFELEGECLVLGPVAVDADDIRTATSVPAQPMGRSLSIELTPAGLDKFNALAEAQLGGRVAVLVDGTVVSAPTVRDASFSGSVTVTGLTDEQLRRVTDGFGRRGGGS